MHQIKHTLYNVAVSVCFGMACIVLFELYARNHAFLGNDYPNSSHWYKEKWYENHPKNNPVITGNSTDRYHPVIGWVMRENLDSIDVNGGYVSSNSKGCRGKQEFNYQRNGKLRVLFIGDSFTFGECVNDNETFPAYTQALLDSTEVINIAVHGHGHDQILLRLQEEGRKYKPDIVVLGFFNDDANRNALWFRDYAKPKFELQSDSLILTGVPIPTVDELQAQRPPKIVGLAKAAWGKLSQENYSDANVPLTNKILLHIANECKLMSAPLLVVYMPWQNECEENKAYTIPAYDTMITYPGVTAINPVPELHAFLQTQPNAEQHFRCHYTPAVNSIIGNKIAAHIRQMNVSPKAAGN